MASYPPGQPLPYPRWLTSGDHLIPHPWVRGLADTPYADPYSHWCRVLRESTREEGAKKREKIIGPLSPGSYLYDPYLTPSTSKTGKTASIM